MTQGWKHFMHVFVQSSPSQTSKDCHPENCVPKNRRVFTAVLSFKPVAVVLLSALVQD